MREVFYEESSVHTDKLDVKKYNLFKILSYVFYALLVIWFVIIFNFFDLQNGSAILSVLIIFLPATSLFLLGFFSNKLKNTYCADYDYTFVSGSLRFSKVIHGVKRVPLYKFESDSIEKIGNIDGENFKKFENMPDVKIVRLTSNVVPSADKKLYYLSVSGVEPGRLVLVIECTETFIKYILQFTNITVLDKDFK